MRDKEDERSIIQFIIHGSCGAFLALLAAISVQFWFHDVNWWGVGGCAIFGFVLAGFLGEQAIDFLMKVFWWS
jgi:hypothetical protein